MYKILSWILILTVLISGGIYLYKNNLSKEITIQDLNDLELIDKFYISKEEKEAWITFSDKDAFLSLIDTEYENIQMEKVSDAQHSKFENKELNLSLIEDQSRVDVYMGDEIIFSGKDREIVLYEKLINNTWVWNKTYNSTGPNMDVDDAISPKKEGAFTLQFTSDGKVSGTTDCNNFGGEYKLDSGEIWFGNFAMTEMFCPDSQEAEFISMLKEGTYSIGSQNFYIENDQTVVFNLKK